MSNEDKKKNLPAKLDDIEETDEEDFSITQVERPEGSEEIQIPEIAIYENETQRQERAVSAAKQEFENRALSTQNLFLKRQQASYVSYMNAQTDMIAGGSDLVNKRILNIGRHQSTIRNAIEELNAPRTNFLIVLGIAIFVLFAYGVSSNPSTAITINNIETDAQTQVFTALIIGTFLAAGYMFLKYKRRI